MENGQRRYGLSRTTVSNCEKIVSLPTVAPRRNRRLGFYRLFKDLHGGEAYWLPAAGLPAFNIVLAAVKMRAAL